MKRSLKVDLIKCMPLHADAHSWFLKNPGRNQNRGGEARTAFSHTQNYACQVISTMIIFTWRAGKSEMIENMLDSYYNQGRALKKTVEITWLGCWERKCFSFYEECSFLLWTGFSSTVTKKKISAAILPCLWRSRQQPNAGSLCCWWAGEGMMQREGCSRRVEAGAAGGSRGDEPQIFKRFMREKDGDKQDRWEEEKQAAPVRLYMGWNLDQAGPDRRNLWCLAFKEMLTSDSGKGIYRKSQEWQDIPHGLQFQIRKESDLGRKISTLTVPN